MIYRLIRLIIFVFNLSPRNAAVFAGGWLGLAAWYLLPRDRYKFMRNLTLVYKESLTLNEKSNLSRNFFINSGKNLAEVLRFKKYFHTQIKPLVEIEGLEYFDQAYRTGRGIIGITGHIGNFELLAVYLASLGFKIAVIGREMYDRRLDELLVENREATGLINIVTTDSPRKAMSWLKEGGVLGVLIDTDSFRVRSMFIPAFGRLSHTPVGQTMLGLRTGAAFIPAVCLRTPDNRYRIIIRPPIEYIEGDCSEKAVYDVTLKCTKALEEIIDRYKDQWIWLHNRWHTKP
ncbi:MAG: lysophospholipid acyltransferase family protein [Candidatus Zixiibacteriota bacterium]